MYCSNNFNDCLSDKIEHKGKCDIFLECTKCLDGRTKQLETCCISPDKIFVNLPRSDGKPTKRNYCRNCGDTSPVIKMDPPTEFLSLPLLNKYVQNSTQTARREKWSNFYAYLKEAKEKAITKENEDFRDRYHAYLKTKTWFNRRLKVLKRDGFLCQGCLENKATQVHHTTYERVFDEPLFDLISVCDSCHNKIHNTG